MTKELTLRQLRYFAAAAETGQISMAASQVCVSQSAITNAVLMLEESLGVQLFERHPQGVVLTAEGKSFYRHARHILDSVQDALRSPTFPAASTEGTIRIGASYTLLGYFLPPLLARFRARFPNIVFDLHDMERERIEAGVLSEELELGIVLISNVEDRDRFENHVLMRSRRQLWTAENHPLLALPTPTLDDIAAYPYIQLTVDECEESTHRYWQSRGLAPNTAFRTGSMEALRGLIAHGFGVAILSDMVYRPWSLEGKKIEARPVLDAVPPMELGLIKKREREESELARIFSRFLLYACDSQ